MAEGTATVSSAAGKETKTEIEVIEYVNGYFYVEDTGAYAGKRGNCEDCYVLNKGVNITNNLENAEYTNQEVKNINIQHENLKKKAATIYGESSAYLYGKTSKAANDEIFAIAEVFKINNKAYGAKSELAKIFLANTDKLNNDYESRKAAYAAIIYIEPLTNPKKYSNGATHWDGQEQAIYNTDKKGVTKKSLIKEEGEFTDDSTKSRFELHMNTWGWYIKDEHYLTWKTNIGTAFKAPQKKKATYGINKGKICALSTAVYNKTIFWKVKNGGYNDEELK